LEPVGVVVQPLFHIFRCEPDGIVIWQAAVETLDMARTRVQVLAASSPGAFIVFNPSSGQKLSIGKIESFKLAASKSAA
jgi:hypothetical protein